MFLPAAPCRILPLRLCRQAIFLYTCPVKFFYKFLNIKVTHILNRTFITSYQRRRICLHYLKPLPLRNLIHAHIKIIHANLVNRFLIRIAVFKYISHIKTAAIYKYHPFGVRSACCPPLPLNLSPHSTTSNVPLWGQTFRFVHCLPDRPEGLSLLRLRLRPLCVRIHNFYCPV